MQAFCLTVCLIVMAVQTDESIYNAPQDPAQGANPAAGYGPPPTSQGGGVQMSLGGGSSAAPADPMGDPYDYGNPSAPPARPNDSPAGTGPVSPPPMQPRQPEPRSAPPRQVAPDNYSDPYSNSRGSVLDDNLVRQGSQPVQPAQAAEPTVNDTAAKQIVGMLFSTENAPVQVQGRPLTMQAVLDRYVGGADRFQAIRAYWVLSRRWADLLVATDKVTLLEPHANKSSVLRAGYAEAVGQEKAAQLRFLEAQRDVARWMGMSVADKSVLPLPQDAPLARTYATRFEEVFRGRYVTDEARVIHEQLPDFHELTALRGNALLQYLRARDETMQTFQAGRESATNTLMMVEQTEKAYGKFLDTLFHYNDRIARYAMEAGGQVDSGRAVAMLIHRPATAMSPADSVRPISGARPIVADQRPSLTIQR